jgi:hypothetical protein
MNPERCPEKYLGQRQCILTAGHEGKHKAEPLGHHCHAKGCLVETKPELLMCLKHWRMVPKSIQDRVWAHYRRGQCDDKNPSAEWHKAADDAIAVVFKKEQEIAELRRKHA